MKRFEGKVAVITGGAGSRGLATAEAFVEEGAKVVIADLDKKSGIAVAKRLTDNGYDIIFVKANVSKEPDVENLMSKTVEKYGRLDALFANAGIGNNNILYELDIETWNKSVGLTSPAFF